MAKKNKKAAAAEAVVVEEEEEEEVLGMLLVSMFLYGFAFLDTSHSIN